MDPQLQQRLMLYAGIIPGAIALVAMLAAWYIHAFRVSRVDLEELDEDEPARLPQGPRWLLPILLILGVAGADYAIHDQFTLWPDDNTARYTHAIALIALMAIAEGLVRLPMLVVMLMRFVAYAGAFWMLSEGFVETVFASSANLVAYSLFAAGATTLIATGADQHAQHNHHEKPLGWLDAISWLLIIGAAMPMLKENRFGLGAMLSSGIISVLVSATIVSLIFSSVSLARGSITVLAGFVLMTLTGAFVQVGTQDFISVPAALLLATLPLVVLIPLHTPSGIKRLITRAAIIIAIAGGAAYFVYIHNDSSADTGSDDQYQSTEDYYESLDQ